MLEVLKASDLFNLAKKKTIPISVLVEVTYKCNENCVHCYLNEHRSQGMSLRQYEDLFDEMAKAGTLYLTLTGGEPFTRPDFLDIVRAARKRRISVKIFTNGTLITANIAKELKALFVQEVHISVYSATARLHDQVTRMPGSFMRSISAIEMLVSCGVNVRIKCPLMNLAANDLESIKLLAQRLNVPVQFFTIITAKDNGDKSTLNLRLSHEHLCHFLEGQDILERPRTTTNSRSGIEPDAVPCDVVFDGGAIDPTGNVFPCNQLRVKFGNVLSEKFGAIWRSSAEAIALRKLTASDLRECNSCELLRYCSRCPGLALLEDGDIFGCSLAAKFLAEGRREVKVYPSQSHIFSTFKKAEARNHEEEKGVC